MASAPAPVPVPQDLTVLVLRGPATQPDIRHPIEARLAASGFSILAESLQVSSEADEAPQVPGCRPGRNLVSLLQRQRAVQVLRELVGVGVEPDLSTTGEAVHPTIGTLRATYGQDAVWAPVDQGQVIEVMQSVFPDMLEPVETDKPEKRVFTFQSADDEPLASPGPRHPSSSTASETDLHRTVSSTTAASSVASLSSSTASSLAHPGPRLSKAACLRMGIPWHPPSRPSLSASTSASSTPGVHQRRLDVLPASLAPPSILPRQTKASALRTGAPLPSSSHSSSSGGGADDDATPPTPRSKRSEAELFASTPGHKYRRASLQMVSSPVTSTAPPSMPPILTKASDLRLNYLKTGEAALPSVTQRRESRDTHDRSAGFEGLPGFRKVKAPLTPDLPASLSQSVGPRQNRASALRSSLGGAFETGSYVPSATVRRESKDTSQRSAGFEGLPGFRKAKSTPASEVVTAESNMVRPNRASLLRSTGSASSAGAMMLASSTGPRARPSLDIGQRARTSMGIVAKGREGLDEEEEDDATLTLEDRRRATFQGVPGHKRDNSITVASTRSPSVAPRLNRAAALRASVGGAVSPGPSGPSSPRVLPQPTVRPRSSLGGTAKASLDVPSARTVAGGSRSPSMLSRFSSDLVSTPEHPEPASKRSHTPSSIMASPSIVPRMNRAAALRGGTGQVQTSFNASGGNKENESARSPVQRRPTSRLSMNGSLTAKVGPNALVIDPDTLPSRPDSPTKRLSLSASTLGNSFSPPGSLSSANSDKISGHGQLSPRRPSPAVVEEEEEVDGSANRDRADTFSSESATSTTTLSTSPESSENADNLAGVPISLALEAGEGTPAARTPTVAVSPASAKVSSLHQRMPSLASEVGSDYGHVTIISSSDKRVSVVGH